MLLISFVYFLYSKISTNRLKNQATCFQIKLFKIGKGMIKSLALNLWTLILLFNQCLTIFRDNGTTIQIMSYQVYTELILFFGFMILLLLPIEKDMIVQKFARIFSAFAIYVIQPLFYLNGDVNFRNQVHNQGSWRNLKKELFPMTSQIQPMP